MATSKMYKTLDLQGGETVTGVPTAVSSSDVVPKSQLDTVADTKQNNVSAGSGIGIDGTTISVDLATSGTDYSNLILSSTSHVSLDGTYVLAPFKGSLSYSGTELDLDVGGNYNVYYKTVGTQTWAVVAKRDVDNIGGNNSSYENTGSWIAVLTSVDPSSITEDYTAFIPNYQSVDYDFLTYSSEQDDNGNVTISSAAAGVTYAAGATPAGLIFDNHKLAIDFAQTVGDSASTKVFPSSVVKTYVDEKSAHASDSANNGFSNAVAQLQGNPSNVQTMGEALKSHIDTLSNVVSSNQNTAATEYSNIDNLQSAVGCTSDNLGTTHATLTNNTTVKALIDELAVLIAGVRSDSDTSIGITTGQLLSAISATVSDGSNIQAALTQIVAAIETIQGDLTSRLPAVDYYHNAAQYPLTAGQLDGTETVNSFVYDHLDLATNVNTTWTVDATSNSGVVNVLVDFGPAGDVDAGVYSRDPSTGYLTRVTWLNEATEVQKNAILQVRYGGAIAGSEFMIVTPDEPAIGADVIGFENIFALIIGQNTIAKDKLKPDFRNELEDLPRQFGPMAFTVPADGDITVTHGLMKESPRTVMDSSGNDISGSLELDSTVPGELTISYGGNSDLPVVVTLVGKRV